MFILIIILSFFLSLFFTFLVRFLALRLEVVDRPNSDRKIHKKPIPLMGGLAIFLAYFLLLLIFRKHLVVGDLSFSHWQGVFLGAVFLLIGGLLDDKYNLSPRWQIVWPVLAALALILGGVSVDKITHPFGGLVYFSSIYSSVFVFLWILGMTYTTKILDGLDGLATGVTAIGSLIIFLFTITSRYYQPDIAIAALIFFVVLLGFLYFNFNPAVIFLGESGALLLGYILGVLSIISGGKIAIALLVMGLPILDLAWTILRRLLSGKNPFRSADRRHLHHRLLDLGWSQKQAVLFFYSIAAFFGFGGLFLQSKGKFWALASLGVLMLLIIIFFNLFDKSRLKILKTKPRLLLHVCCAPCALALISEKLLNKYQVVLYFYNSNLDSLEEFKQRKNCVEKMAQEYGLDLIIEPYDHQAWLEAVASWESEVEGGYRCTLCYRDRLEKTAQLAKKLKIKNFFTSLSTSPHKDFSRIKKIASDLAQEYSLNFITIDDFDRSALYRRSLDMAKDRSYYRQKYCGCEFSLRGDLKKLENID